jgi:hypothetical protein
VAYHSAGIRWGTATFKFYEGRDILPPLPPAPVPILGGELLVGHSQPQTRLAVVPLRAEINFTNAREVAGTCWLPRCRELPLSSRT